MSLDQWWDDTDRGKQNYSGANLSHCHSLYHNCTMDYPGIETFLLWQKLCHLWPETWHCRSGIRRKLNIITQYINIIKQYINKYCLIIFFLAVGISKTQSSRNMTFV